MMRFVFVSLALIILASCHPHNEQICSTPPPLDFGAVPSAQDYNTCAHRWGYRLARSDEPAKTVAEAVYYGCKKEMSPDNYASDPSGEKAKGFALFIVLQARAGNCRLP
jgi:hypothetical protein